MKKDLGYYVMSSVEYDNWIKKYNAIMDDPNSTHELLNQIEIFNDMVVIEG